MFCVTLSWCPLCNNTVNKFIICNLNTYMIRRHDSVLILRLFLLNNKHQLSELHKFSVSEELFTLENIFVFHLAFMIIGGKWVQKVSVDLISAFLNLHVHIQLHIITCMYTFGDVLTWFIKNFVLQNSLKHSHMYLYI